MLLVPQEEANIELNSQRFAAFSETKGPNLKSWPNLFVCNPLAFWLSLSKTLLNCQCISIALYCSNKRLNKTACQFSLLQICLLAFQNVTKIADIFFKKTTESSKEKTQVNRYSFIQLCVKNRKPEVIHESRKKWKKITNFHRNICPAVSDSWL